jgi:hypothetical protein
MSVSRIEDKVRIIEAAEGNGCRFEILEYQELTGSEDVGLAETLFYAKQAGIRLKMVRITISQSEVVTESGALYFMKGNIEMDSPTGGVTGLAKKLIASRLTKEDTFKPHYRGTGEIYLEPTFSHFVLVLLLSTCHAEPSENRGHIGSGIRLSGDPDECRISREGSQRPYRL